MYFLYHAKGLGRHLSSSHSLSHTQAPHTHKRTHSNICTFRGCQAAWVVCCSLGDSAICCLASQGGQSLPLHCCPDSEGSPQQYITSTSAKSACFYASDVCYHRDCPRNTNIEWDTKLVLISHPDFIQNGRRSHIDEKEPISRTN